MFRFGRDATISWGGPEFKFKNNRQFPIKIIATTSNGTITISIRGIKQDDDYEVVIESTKIEVINYKTQYINDNTLPVGTQQITQQGSNGYISETYKILKRNGKEVSRVFVSRDKYNPKAKIVKVGTMLQQIEE